MRLTDLRLQRVPGTIIIRKHFKILQQSFVFLLVGAETRNGSYTKGRQQFEKQNTIYIINKRNRSCNISFWHNDNVFISIYN